MFAVGFVGLSGLLMPLFSFVDERLPKGAMHRLHQGVLAPQPPDSCCVDTDSKLLNDITNNLTF